MIHAFARDVLDSRIKKCPTCGRKSTLSKEERRLYMQNLRAKKKAERDNLKLEERIARMTKAGYSREEAIEIIKADASA